MAVPSPLLDDINRRLLAELEANARTSLAELGRRVNLSSAAVGERLARLERDGVISRYEARVNPRALGYTVRALVRIRPVTRQLHRIPELAMGILEVTECYRVTGEDCFVLMVHLREMDDLEAILDRFAPLGQTTTSIVHSAPIPTRPLPLEPPAARHA
jgi:Lrp/AsnC family leucine-responsive transcriptional regulator